MTTYGNQNPLELPLVVRRESASIHQDLQHFFATLWDRAHLNPDRLILRRDECARLTREAEEFANTHSWCLGPPMRGAVVNRVTGSEVRLLLVENSLWLAQDYPKDAVIVVQTDVALGFLKYTRQDYLLPQEES